MTISTESKRGTNLTGDDGDTDRTLTLANICLTQEEGFNVWVNGANLVPDTEYSVTHDYMDSIITFKNKTWNTDYIKIIYQQTSGRG